MKKWIFLVVLAVILAGGYAVYRKLTGNGAETVRYEPVDFQKQRMEVSIEASGVAEPRNRIEIKPPINGRIEEILVEEGETVKKGQTIGSMSSIERATLLDAARAKGDAVFRKWESAYKPTPLIAPLDGTIIARSAEPGQTVTSQDVILILSDRLIVTAQVDETDIGQVRVGQPSRIILDAYPDVKTMGIAKRIAFQALTVNNVTVYEVEVDPEKIPGCMKSGMTATVGFRVAEANDVLTLPADAVLTEGGKSVVLLDDGNPDTPPERSRVLTGLSSGGRIEILAGLTGRESVVRRAFSVAEREKTGTSPFMPSRRK